MTTKKIVIIVAAVAFTVGLLVLLFVGGIVGIAFYSIGKSEAAVTAKDFLRNNERLKQDVGTIKDFGSFITGNINIHNNDGDAVLNLKVIGERRTVNATVELVYRSGRPWRVTAASYKNEPGEIVDLLSAFETQRRLLPLLVA
ncbi:MAG: cytochrome c oxidase assembly factor Coa1 family protein [Pyrinomonadaceae bacterium]